MIYFLTIVFILVALFLIMVVLVQRGRGGGLSGAFGSGGGSSSAFGTKTGDVFTWATVILFAVFMVMAVWLNWKFRNYKEAIVGMTPTVSSAPAPGASTPTTPSSSAQPELPPLPAPAATTSTQPK